MSRWTERGDVPMGDAYDERWRRLEAQGRPIHGEADLIMGYEPRSVLDAGCGTGRVAIELARRGVEVAGVDLDAGMLASAQQKAPGIEWVRGDLVDVELRHAAGGRRRFDVVAMPGNVMIFVARGTEAAVVANLTRHLSEEGRLIAGFELVPGGFGIEGYDEACARAGLRLEDRWATWDGEPYQGGRYAVSVHRRQR